MEGITYDNNSRFLEELFMKVDAKNNSALRHAFCAYNRKTLDALLEQVPDILSPEPLFTWLQLPNPRGENALLTYLSNTQLQP